VYTNSSFPQERDLTWSLAKLRCLRRVFVGGCQKASLDKIDFAGLEVPHGPT